MAERREELRAADVDRQFVADRLKAALDEGRLSLGEYDDRLKETYSARTYGDLDKVHADLPPTTRSQMVPAPPSAATPAQDPVAPAAGGGRPRWIAPAWGSWLTVTLILNAIWLATLLGSGGHAHASYWPIWVMLPWGAVLLAGTISGAAHGGRRDYHDARRDVRDARRNERRQRRQERRGY